MNRAILPFLSIIIILINGIIASSVGFISWILYAGILQIIMIFPLIILAYTLFIILNLITMYISIKILDKIRPIKKGLFREDSKEYKNWVYRNSVIGAYGVIFEKMLPRVFDVFLYKILGLKIKSIPKLIFAGTIIEPQFVEVGKNVTFGNSCIITAHTFVNDKIFIKKIKIGDNVTIGTSSIIFPGVEVGDNSIIGAGAVVTKNTKIPKNEVWVGIPAKRIKKIKK